MQYIINYHSHITKKNTKFRAVLYPPATPLHPSSSPSLPFPFLPRPSNHMTLAFDLAPIHVGDNGRQNERMKVSMEFKDRKRQSCCAKGPMS